MTEREQFEAWAKARYAKNPHFWLRQIDDGGYSCGMADSAWDAWQAARAQPAQAVPVLTDDEIGDLLDAARVPELPHGYEDVDLRIARAVEAAVRAKMGVAVPMTAAGQMFAEAKKAVGVTFRVNPNLDAETVRQAHVAVSEAPPYELPDWQKAALCVCREVVTAWGSEESRAAHGIVGKEDGNV